WSRHHSCNWPKPRTINCSKNLKCFHWNEVYTVDVISNKRLRKDLLIIQRIRFQIQETLCGNKSTDPGDENTHHKDADKQTRKHYGVFGKFQFWKRFIEIIQHNCHTNQGDESTNNSQLNIFKHKRASDKGFCGTHHLHCFDDESFGINRQSDRAVDQ